MSLSKLNYIPRKAFSTSFLVVAFFVLIAGCSTDSTSTPETTPETKSEPTATTTSRSTSTPTSPPTPTSTTVTESPATPTSVPTSTDIPTPELSPTVEPTLAPTQVDPTAAPPQQAPFSAPPDRDLYQLAQTLVLKSPEPIPRIVNPEPVSYQIGHKETFSVTDIEDVRSYKTQATLRLVSPHAYWYVEDGVDITQRNLERSADVFEQEIYPRVTAAFGTEWTPGVDNDPHLTILHARLRGVAGYFSSVDEYPTQVHQFSNQREMIYMASSLRVGTRSYLSVLAHELQHAVHWNGDSSEETWVNEGLSELASRAAGYRPRSQDIFLNSPTISLVNWPVDAPTSIYYGGSFLFFDYLASHYGNLQDIQMLVKEPLDDIAGINAYLSRLGFNVTFRDVFRDWTVANLLDEPEDGPYSYPDNEVRVRIGARVRDGDERQTAIAQFSAEYVRLDLIKGDVRLGFQGQKENSMLPISLEEGRCWWSNRGDSISSTLTRPLDLTGVDRATLRYRTWFDVEESWDYAYVQISTDGGFSWDIIQAPGTSPRNPVGNSFGPGYTGTSDGWMEEEVDLTPYAGSRVHLRFHYITDDAINGTGLCFDDISVPEIGFSDGDSDDGGWETQGFLSIDNVVPQKYIVQVVEIGDENTVREMVLDQDNSGVIEVLGLEDLNDVIVIVAPTSSDTLLDASYTLTVESIS